MTHDENERTDGAYPASWLVVSSSLQTFPKDLLTPEAETTP